MMSTNTTSRNHPLVTVIIANYNYARFVAQAIASVLEQTYKSIELIIVDDGSADDSRSVIETFQATNVRKIFRANGGQAAAWNDGFKVANGSVIIFLDADDTLLPNCVAQHAAALSDPAIARSQGYLAVTRADGERTGSKIPGVAPTRDPLTPLLAFGPSNYICAPTSGNAWQKGFLDRLFPLPEIFFGADALLFDVAPLFGKTFIIEADIATYRQHGESFSDKKQTPDAIGIKRWLTERTIRAERAAAYADREGFHVEAKTWSDRSWREQLMRDLLARFERTVRPSAWLALKAAWKAPTSFPKRVMLLILLSAIRIAPLYVAVRASVRLSPL